MKKQYILYILFVFYAIIFLNTNTAYCQEFSVTLCFDDGECIETTGHYADESQAEEDKELEGVFEEMK